MNSITHDELLTFWKLDAVRHLKNSVTSLKLYASEVSLEDVSLGMYYDDLALEVEAILKTYMGSIRGEVVE